MSVSDDLMWRYYSLVLGRPEAEIAALRRDVAAGRVSPRQAKDDLAKALVDRFHGEPAGSEASAEFARIFSKGQLPDEVPEIALPPGVGAEGMKLSALLVHAGLAKSSNEARRLIEQGAVRVGETRVTDPLASVAPPPGTVIRAGKRGFAKIRAVS